MGRPDRAGYLRGRSPGFGASRSFAAPTLRACFRHGGLRIGPGGVITSQGNFIGRGIHMIRYRSVRAAFAGAVVVALAGCASAGTSGAAANGTPAAGTSASAASSATTNPAATASGATPGATSDQVVPAGAIRFPIAVGNTWVYETIASINNAHAVVTKQVLSVAPVPGGHQVTMSATVNPGPTQGTTQEYYLFYANGQIGFPVQEPNGVS